jgi:hypothetical protein
MDRTEHKVNLSINEGEAFFSNEMSVNYNPLHFIMDFKLLTPRMDPRSPNAPSLHLKHNVVLVDPYHMKKIMELLQQALNDYEKEFGKIKVPKAVEIAQKKQGGEVIGSTSEGAPSYFG